MEEKNKISLRGISKATLLSVVMSALLTIISALVFYFFEIPDTVISVTFFIIPVAAVFLSSLFLAKGLPGNGLIHGGIVGLMFFIVFFAMSVIVNKGGGFSVRLMCILAAVCSGGMLGGVLGINSAD